MRSGSTLYVAILLAAFSLVTPGMAKGDIKNGFYKVESVTDGSVLTATWNGLPREVITDDWKESGLQEWRIRAINNNGLALHMVRNEFVKNNEVNKEQVSGTAGPGKKPELVIAEWNFVTVNGAAKENTFEVNNGVGCLKNNGKGSRISIVDCDPSAKDQQWHFEFLYAKAP